MNSLSLPDNFRRLFSFTVFTTESKYSKTGFPCCLYSLCFPVLSCYQLICLPMKSGRKVEREGGKEKIKEVFSLFCYNNFREFWDSLSTFVKCDLKYRLFILQVSLNNLPLLTDPWCWNSRIWNSAGSLCFYNLQIHHEISTHTCNFLLFFTVQLLYSL